MKLKFRIFVLFFFFSAVVLATSPQSPTPPTSSIKIAVLLPLNTPLGKQMWQAIIQAAVDTQDNVIFIPYNTSYNPKEAVQNALQNNVSAIIGPLFSRTLIKIAPLLPTNIPVYPLSNQRTNIPTFWPLGFYIDEQINVLKNVVGSDTELNVLLPETAYGDAIKKQLDILEENNEIHIINSQFYPLKKPKYTKFIHTYFRLEEHNHTTQTNLTYLNKIKELKLTILTKRMQAIKKYITQIKTATSIENSPTPTSSTLPIITPVPPTVNKDERVLTQAESALLDQIETQDPDQSLSWETFFYMPLQTLENYISHYKKNPVNNNMSSITLLLAGDSDLTVRNIAEEVANAFKTPSKLHFIGLVTWGTMSMLPAEPALFGAQYIAPYAPNWKKFAHRFKHNFRLSPHRLISLAYDAVQIVNATHAQLITQPISVKTLDGTMTLSPNGGVTHTYGIVTIQTHKRILSPIAQ